MKIPKRSIRTAKQLFKSCVRDGQLDESLVRRVVTALLQSKPRDYLAVLMHFKRLVKLEIQRRTAVVETAIPMDPAQAEQLRDTLERNFGAGLRFVFAHRPELIGGMRVQVGSRVYDGTIRAQLDELKAAFGAEWRA
ncbi:MAG: F0F1 ATP synthase subunit delta [Verrucomicrobiae bacterium]|nr:F0F1 ATP synthase subunit delta [Verrucomicrobiae bacterium]MCX7722746.1 F0F1 ATP synthase subunit delta [Verrucomicrobiae bacterium]MDW7981147.1 F0F1 ATP synthase subunit delta [Verrucomicrobiales bacterium]